MNKPWNNFLLIIIFASIFLISNILRFLFAVNEAIFIDEFPNVFESNLFFHYVFSTSPNLSGLGIDVVKPPFYRIAMGFGIFIMNYLWRNSTQIPSLTLSTLFARIFLIILSDLIYIYIIVQMGRKKLLFTFFLFLYIFFNPLLLFNTTIAETGAFIIPLSFMLLYLLNSIDLSKPKTLIKISVVLAIMISIQFYAFLFFIYTLIIISYKIINSREYKSLRYSSIEILKLFSIYILIIPLILFLFLNPDFLINPISTFSYTIKEIAFPLTVSSGVYNLGVFFLGKAVPNDPWYSPFIYLFLQTPLFLLLVFIYGVFRSISDFISHKNMQIDLGLSLISILFFAGNLTFLIGTTHFRSVTGFVIFLLPEVLVLSAFGSTSAMKSLEKFIEDRRGYYKNSKNEKFEKNRSVIYQLRNERSKYALLTLLLLLLIVPAIVNPVPDFSYSNQLGLKLYKSGNNIDGAFNSGQADMEVSLYMTNHGIVNQTVVSLALTPDLSYYSPTNNYVQFWPTSNPVNSSYLISNYLGNYLVLDEYYVQLYGNPTNGHGSLFRKITEVNLTSGYSILYKIGPTNIVQNSSIVAKYKIILTNNSNLSSSSDYVQTIVINSSKFQKFEFENLSNVEFTYSNLTLIPSFLYSGNANTYSSSTYYLKLDQILRSFSSFYIYVVFSKYVVMNGIYEGENPNLPNVPFQLDNGADVFKYYSLLRTNNSAFYENISGGAHIIYKNYMEITSNSSGYAVVGSNLHYDPKNLSIVTQISVCSAKSNYETILKMTPWTLIKPEFGVEEKNGAVSIFYNNLSIPVNTSNITVIFSTSGNLSETLIINETNAILLKENSKIMNDGLIAPLYYITFTGDTGTILKMYSIMGYNNPIGISQFSYSILG